MKNHELDWPELLNQISQHANSKRAKDHCLNLMAFSSAELATQSIENILFAQNILIDGGRPDLTSLDFTVAIFERLKIHAVLSVKELILLRDFLNAAASLKIMLKQTKNRWCDSLNSKIADLKSQLSAINHVISPQGEINEDASQALSSLCQEKRKLQRDISKTLDQIISRRHIESVLQDKYVTNREGRMVIPVKSGNQHDVKGLIHDASHTKQTVFMEPEEVVPMNNRLRQVQIQIEDEIQKILKELSDYLTRNQLTLTNADSAILEADEVLAKAVHAKKIKAKAVSFNNKAQIHIIDAKHPLLVHQGVDVVPNTVTLDKEKRILLLSGPNAGGKTVLLKTIGLISQMARCGLPVTASEGSTIPFFNKIDPVVGDLQSVEQNLSSFSSHILRLNEALKHKSTSTLLLIDEICGATSPEEGAALARSFIEKFSGQEIFVIVTSHLEPLKESWNKAFPILHGSLEFDTHTNKPTYQLLLGFPGRSLAISVAKRLGTPIDILTRAEELISPETRKKNVDLKEIEDHKGQIIELKRQALENKNEAQKSKETYSELIRKFREQRDRWLEKALEKAQKRIEQMIEDARLERLKQKTLYDIKSELPEIIKSRGQNLKPQTIDEFKTLFKPGTSAYSSRLQRKVVIQSEPDGKGQVTVQADSMRIQLPWHSLTLAQEENQPTPVVVRRSSASSTKIAEEREESLDLRGYRVDEALEKLEKWLDECIREQHDNVKVIHGFGTEALKKSVRQFLSKSRYVAKWSPGDTQSGGDGTTVVTLAD